VLTREANGVMDEVAGASATLVLGLGNPILGDDGVGWRVADAVEARLGARDTTRPVEVDRMSLGGLRLMERMIGYDRAIIVDAVETGTLVPGTVRCLRLDALPRSGRERLASPHDGTLVAALEVGRSLGARLPGSPWVVAVEARLDNAFDERLSPDVDGAVAVAARHVLRLLDEMDVPVPFEAAPEETSGMQAVGPVAIVVLPAASPGRPTAAPPADAPREQIRA
jgi:hydrogenase maturation protease